MSSRDHLNNVIADPETRARLIRQFQPKVEKRDDAQCWPWIARAKHKAGYGALNVKGRVLFAHTIAWALENGPIPDGGHVLHTCDVHGCCNPKHLYIGDNQKNAADRVARGLTNAGMKHSAETRRKIREGRAANPPKVSEDGNRRRSEALKRRWQDQEWRDRFSSLVSGENNHLFGKPIAPKRMDAIIAAARARKGCKLSEDHKQKIRASHLARRANENQ